ncbi:unnamed protein product [Ilex paraguariensis]|uniref:Ribosomal protein L34Ae n=1 Tax=Ilex paraguariensis TaxID=185542 RepID=A0ABC8UBP9_9AQUA
MGSVKMFLYQKLVLFVRSFWFSVSTYLLPWLGVITTYLFRFKKNKSSSENNSKFSELISEENCQKNPSCNAPESVLEVKNDSFSFSERENDEVGEKETPAFCFKFKFPTFEEFSKSSGVDKGFLSSEVVPSISTSKYEFMPEKSFSGFIEEPEFLSFDVKEANIDKNSGSLGVNEIVEDGFLSEMDFKKVHSEPETVHDEVPENVIDDACLEEEIPEKIEATTFTEEKLEPDDEDNISRGDQDEVHSENDSISMESDSESMSLSHMHSVMSHLIDSYSDGFLSDGDFGGEFELDTLMDNDGEKKEHYDGMPDFEDHESDDFDDEDSDIMEELKKLEEVHLQNPFVSQNDFGKELDKSKNEEFNTKDDKPVNGSGNSEKLESKNSSDLDSEDEYDLETLWEHQELIEQLKMELKKVRATGLPTIMEESESPKMEDLKPWKIDEKFQREDCIGELHKFYKSYRERMRKFDILNYQKMYAIGFLQLKDPLQSITRQKTSVPAFTSLLSQSFKSYKKKKVETDPMIKFIGELQSDLEVVYVGQMCLSWEILQWQYEKTLDLWEADPRRIHLYNEVAGEFQQFQVLMQRFIEDEPFQGPRVQNYVKNRCVLRNLLQIPLIREDSSKDKRKAKMKEKGEYAITSDMLVEIMEESIRIFWRFVRADKDCTNVISKDRRGTPVELQDPEDSKLLLEVRRNLQKKERKLKDLLRSGNCILRKFQRCREDESDQVLCFFSQVDMKLVSRVLNMSRITTDQLFWCRNKLSNISFVNRKIHVESSFLLFPC